jgi:hypothetical protein
MARSMYADYIHRCILTAGAGIGKANFGNWGKISRPQGGCPADRNFLARPHPSPLESFEAEAELTGMISY